jgi:hypothetical protein
LGLDLVFETEAIGGVSLEGTDLLECHLRTYEDSDICIGFFTSRLTSNVKCGVSGILSL